MTMSNDTMLKLISMCNERPCQMCTDSQRRGDLRSVAAEPDLQNAHDALGIWRVRNQTVAAAGRALEGFEDLERELTNLSANDRVYVAAFVSTTHRFIVVADAVGARLLGCLSIVRQVVD